MHPVLIHSGSVTIPSYGVAAAFGLLLALLLGMRTARQQGLDPNAVWNSSILALFLGAVAAKLWMLCAHFAAFRAAPVLLLNLSALGSGEQAAVAALTAAVVLYLYARSAGTPITAMLDTLAAPLLLLCAAQDVGCLLAGCAYGRPSAGGGALTYHSAYAFVWWGTPLGVPLRPVPVLAAGADLLLAAVAFWMGSWGLRAGRVAAFGMVGAAMVHFLLDFWRGDVFGLGVLPWLTGEQAVCLLLLAAAVPLLWDRRGWRYVAPAVVAQ